MFPEATVVMYLAVHFRDVFFSLKILKEFTWPLAISIHEALGEFRGDV